LEHLYANNVVVTGTWLPYGKHRVHGVQFKEIEKISDLKADDLNMNQSYKDNQSRIDELIKSEKTAQNWLNIYKEAQQISQDQ
ncbi:MAG: hypothetical protein ACPGED_02410, partial [Flavobacteriales bacterium]